MTYWQNKVVLVTGGAAGLGGRLATHFARVGARLVLADRDAAALDQARTALREGPTVVHTVVTDVTQSASVAQLFQRVDDEFGQLDALVNCAGRSGRGAVVDTPVETFQAFLDLNFLGTVRCTQAAMGRLLASRGHVINIGSLAAKMAARYLGAYPASKFAVAAFSHQLRLELGPRGLHVLLVCPGPIARPDAGRRYAAESAQLPEAARQPGGGVRLRGLDPDDLCRRILRAAERRVPELVVPRSARLLAALLQLWPTLGDRIIGRMTG
ncbi:MAG: SDR family NAD(P)-dependent oxidoreductase [Pirellulaceae bacterium]|jgi:short-subunit dehydrogenase|nr:SDR family NAD(P)-dependent oxidoreductase [Pirellulaceae bacterium]